MSGFMSNFFGKPKHDKNKQDDQLFFDDNANQIVKEIPQFWGINESWLAIKTTESTNSLIEKLGMVIAKEVNWTTGRSIARADNTDLIFVSPQLEGYVFILYIESLKEKDIETVASCFSDVQYYESIETSGMYKWIKFEHGKLIRSFKYSVEIEGTVQTTGDITSEEIDLGFEQFPTGEYFRQLGDNEIPMEIRLPQESDVWHIASKWGFHLYGKTPDEINTYPEGFGYLCHYSLKKQAYERFQISWQSQDDYLDW